MRGVGEDGSSLRDPGASAGAAGGSLRPEIQLLRAVAVLAVVFNHLWPGILPGGYLGVDIFFVISGYLITAHLLRELDRTGRVRVARFWARRARRLLPASLLVLLVAAAGTVLVVPVTEWQMVMRQVIASALYVQNWALAHDAQDYFASSRSASPLTHYWSLSVEEQFYLLWPLLAFGAYALGRRLGRPRTAVFAGFAVVVVASLAYSVVETARLPHAAYFVTPARMWQLGIGGLLALVPALARGRHLVAVLGWAALLASLWVFDEQTPAPGWLTLLPVLGTAAVIWAGDAFWARVPRFLRPTVVAGLWIGAISYSVYLWHWPPVVLLPYATGTPLDDTARLLLLPAILLVSWLSMRVVETPARQAAWLVRGRPRRSLVPAALGMAVVVLVGVVVQHDVEQRVSESTLEVAAAADSDPCFGARGVVRRGCPDPYRLRYPSSQLLSETAGTSTRWGDNCSQNSLDSSVVACQFGVPPEQARLRVALTGDSHARHWVTPLDQLAVRHRWNVTVLAKSSCPVNAAPLRTRRFPEYVASCRAWNRTVVDRIADDPAIDVVITSNNSRNYVIEGLSEDDRWRAEVRGYEQVWRRWTDAGKRVVALADVPNMSLGDIPTCVAAADTVDDPCTEPVSRALEPSDPMLEAARVVGDPAVHAADLTDFFCDDRECHSVVGGVVAYSDENHMAGVFSRTLAPFLGRLIRPAMEPDPVDAAAPATRRTPPPG